MIYKNSLKFLYSLKKKKGRLKSAGCFLGFQTAFKSSLRLEGVLCLAICQILSARHSD